MEASPIRVLSRTTYAAVCGGALALALAGCPAELPQNTAGTGGSPYPTGPVFATGGAGGFSGASGFGGVGGVGGTGGSMPPPIQTVTGIPCAHAQLLADNCLSCHSNPTNWSAPMPLVTAADFQAVSKTDPTRKVYQLVAERTGDANRPMPPTGLMEPTSMSGFQQWLAAGAPADPTATCTVTMPPPIDDGMDDPPPSEFENEVCYQFMNHGQNGSTTDTTAYTIANGQNYVMFYHKVPWTVPSVMTSYRTLYDHTNVLHHWLFYTTTQAAPGAVETGIGTHIGQGSQLVAGWAVGGNDVTMPPGITGRLPAPGTTVMVEWHFYNQGAAVADKSGVEICTVPAAQVDPVKVSGLTWLGTENFNGPFGMPAGVESKFTGTCTPSWNNAPNNMPITIYSFLPHMHKLGKNMESYITRANGTKEPVFNKPFQFDNQISYDLDPYLVLNRGDTITSTCTFFNNTNASVAFGPSSDQEMCYQFAFSYPAGALENGVASLAGATNTCW